MKTKDFRQTLGEMKKEIDKEIEQILDLAIEDGKKNDPLISVALQHIKKVALSGGKRIRGALLCQTYWGFGGKEKKKILKVAAAIELVHLFLLIHDDIIDRGKLRHGQPTLHEMLANKYQKKYGDQAEHFGISMAIIIGDMLFSLANKTILEAGFNKEVTTEALIKIQSVVNQTIIGQSQDINIAYREDISESDVLKMYENKTARYTFEGPMHIGAMLAACKNKKSFESISSFSVPLGIAFQIQDDILGIFGKEDKVGKSAASDIEEGKKTLLVIKAYGRANEKQRIALDGIFGKKKISKKEIEMFRQQLIETESLKYNSQLAINFFEKGKKEMEKLIILPKAKKFLAGMVEYLEKREV